MFQLKLPVQKLNLSFAISLVSLSFMPVQAQSVKPVILVQPPTLNSNRQLNQPLSFNAPEPPDDINAPGHRTGGGKRGCENMSKPLTGSKEKLLTALVPLYRPKVSGLVLGLTTASDPIFWFYVPYSPTLAAEFVLQDTAGQTVYQTPITLSGTPGVVSLSLPSTASPLEIGKRYHWYFNIYCQPQQPPVFVHGWIQRKPLNPTLKSQLEQATAKQRVTLFAAQGFWYDALTASAAKSRSDPRDTDWAALLRSVGLDDIATEPMVAVLRGEKSTTPPPRRMGLAEH